MISWIPDHIGPFGFEQPAWLIFVPVLWALAIVIARTNLSGLGTWPRRVALGVRMLVILILVGILAKPSWRREGTNVNVTVVVDESDSVRRPIKGPDGKTVDLDAMVGAYLDEAGSGAKPGDTLTRMTVARKALVQSLYTRPGDKPDSTVLGATDGTNLADSITLALAVPAKDADQTPAAKRILLISDGNETAGDVLRAANSAKTAGVPIDVLPQTYKFDREVMIDRIVAPSTARMGQNVNLRVVLTALTPARGKLSLTINGDPVELGEKAGELSLPVTLEKGTNIIPIPVKLPQAGPQRFEATFTPDDPGMDSIGQNNRSMAVTFVQSEGRVLVLSPTSEEVAPLVRVLTQARIAADVRAPTEAPATLIDWGAYDAVVMANCSSDLIDEQKQKDLRSYVHDLGGGLVMVGGPESFGAGGWIGSPLADALPVKLDPPQKRQMPRGALVLLMHSCEMPKGNYWGQQVALSAVNNLSRLDLAGILEFSFVNGDWWVHPLSEVGNRAAIHRAINSLTFGDMPSFDGLMNKALTALNGVSAGAKHLIIISDGDPQLADPTLLGKFRAAKISISTVLVYPHNRQQTGGYDWQMMRDIATQTKGNFHPIIDEGEFAKLPSIFIKEAQLVKRALIWEGEPFVPTLSNAASEPMRGLSGAGMPPVSGYIVTAEREGLSVVTLRGKENDPLLAHWQYGLGRSVAFMSDTAVRWAKTWPSWGKYRAFWEQHVRWAMRPGGSADMRVSTEDMGDRTKVIVEALDSKGERLNFVTYTGKVVGPDGSSQDISLRQVGPGRYEGVFESGVSGSYVSNLRYQTQGETGPDGSVTVPAREGNLQAAVMRPYADEFRTLQDNSALLKVLAEKTGGRVIDPNPTKADVWSREGLKMPVSLRPIWIEAALALLGLFLFDVAVRRVRIDPGLIASMLKRGARKSVSQGSQALGSLKDVRERAKVGPGDATAGEEKARRAAASREDKARAATKFEAGAEELKKSRRVEGTPTFGDEAKGERKVEVKDQTAKPDEATNNEQGMSRLMKAKKRAQDKTEE